MFKKMTPEEGGVTGGVKLQSIIPYYISEWPLLYRGLKLESSDTFSVFESSNQQTNVLIKSDQYAAETRS
jgi:hypothetical protein